MGYQWIEFWNWRGRDLDAIRKACDETGVRVAQFIGWGFVPGLNDPANHDAFEKAIKESCEAANHGQVANLVSLEIEHRGKVNVCLIGKTSKS